MQEHGWASPKLDSDMGSEHMLHGLIFWDATLALTLCTLCPLQLQQSSQWFVG